MPGAPPIIRTALTRAGPPTPQWVVCRAVRAGVGRSDLSDLGSDVRPQPAARAAWRHLAGRPSHRMSTALVQIVTRPANGTTEISACAENRLTEPMSDLDTSTKMNALFGIMTER